MEYKLPECFILSLYSSNRSFRNIEPFSNFILSYSGIALLFEFFIQREFTAMLKLAL